MYLKRITNCLLFFTLIYLLHTDAKSIRAVKGETVHLPCHSPPDDSVEGSVKWTKNSKTICDWKFNNKSWPPTGECIPHFTFNGKSFTLNIENVHLSDSGNYSCKTTRMIPPPTLDNTSSLTLHVEAHLSLQLQNSSDDTCVHLICSLESLNPELVNFTWTREGQGSLYSSTSSAMNSELHLCKPNWSNGDTIICHASYSNSQIQSIQLTSQNAPDNALSSGSFWMWIIICSGAAACLILCIILIVVFCKCLTVTVKVVFIVFSVLAVVLIIAVMCKCYRRARRQSAPPVGVSVTPEPVLHSHLQSEMLYSTLGDHHPVPFSPVGVRSSPQ